MFEYVGKVVKIVDGDTIDVNVDLGFSIKTKQRFRLFGIDAWEIRGKERKLGLKAKEWVKEILPIGKDIVVKLC